MTDAESPGPTERDPGPVRAYVEDCKEYGFSWPSIILVAPILIPFYWFVWLLARKEMAQMEERKYRVKSEERWRQEVRDE